MAVSIPPSPPPQELHDRILAALLPQLHLPSPALLRPILQILAYQALHSTTHSSPTKPLQLALKLSSTPSGASELDASLLVDLILAYPNHQNAISTILTRRLDAEPSLLDEFANVILPTSLQSAQSASDTRAVGIAVKALGSLIRSHDDVLSLVVSDLKAVITALQGLYGQLNGDDGLPVKEEILLLAERIIGGAKFDLNSGVQSLGIKSGTPFVDGSLRTDYEAIFNSAIGSDTIPDEVIAKLRSTQDRKARANVRRLDLLPNSGWALADHDTRLS